MALIPARTFTLAARRRQSGLSLIEVMVAVVVLSLGLLGMAALMGVSIRNTQSANYRTVATNLSYDMIDRIRANFSKTALYLSEDFNAPPDDCFGSQEPIDYAGCANTVECDLATWRQKLCQSLPNGRGRVSITTGTATGVGGLTYPNYAVQVEVCWTDDRSQEDVEPSEDCSDTNPLTGGSETLFVVTSGL